MNRFTEALWDIISTDSELLAELSILMGKQYPPFLSPEQSVRVNIRALEDHITSEVTTWVEWLPDTTINRLGGELAMEALCEVDWSDLAWLLRERSGGGILAEVRAASQDRPMREQALKERTTHDVLLPTPTAHQHPHQAIHKQG